MNSNSKQLKNGGRKHRKGKKRTERNFIEKTGMPNSDELFWNIESDELGFIMEFEGFEIRGYVRIKPYCISWTKLYFFISLEHLWMNFLCSIRAVLRACAYWNSCIDCIKCNVSWGCGYQILCLPFRYTYVSIWVWLFFLCDTPNAKLTIW